MNLKLNRTDKLYVDSKSKFAKSEFSGALFQYLSTYYNSEYSDLVILCIGTDRCTGDSLGPLIGYNILNRLKAYNDVHVLGTLNDPVHAKNLNENIDYINTHFNKPFIVAIDACLGSFNKVGFISISDKPLKPGAGVNKILPSVGHVSILGIVNTGGFMEHMVLQSTRLNLVMHLADIISSSFVTTLWKLKECNKKAETQIS